MRMTHDCLISLRLATASSELVEPVVTSKLTEVFFWGAGKQIPQKIDTFTRGNSALQVLKHWGLY